MMAITNPVLAKIESWEELKALAHQARQVMDATDVGQALKAHLETVRKLNQELVNITGTPENMHEQNVARGRLEVSESLLGEGFGLIALMESLYNEFEAQFREEMRAFDHARNGRQI